MGSAKHRLSQPCGGALDGSGEGGQNGGGVLIAQDLPQGRVNHDALLASPGGVFAGVSPAKRGLLKDEGE